jgi:hypothetical protein
LKSLITHSRQDAFKTCRRKHYYQYELGLRRIDDARALRMGSAFHAGIADLGSGRGLEVACESVRAVYARMPEAFEPYEWAIECETILRMVCAYDWRWSGSPLTYIATETAFFLPLKNPATGAPTPVFDLAGKIDGIVRLEDGRFAVKESKTVSEDLGANSAYWRRLRMDHQISLYIHAAREMGYVVDTVLYDVMRKPSIAPTPVPITDGNGIKIVLDSAGNRVKNKNGSWRQTASTEDGYTIQSRPMTTDEWGQKLTDDICARPEFYFARVEIPRLDQDIEEYRQELWEIQQAIREAERTGRHFRTVGRNTCQFCEHFDHCSTNQRIDPAAPPPGFQIVTDLHPELERDQHAQNMHDLQPIQGSVGVQQE